MKKRALIGILSAGLVLALGICMVGCANQEGNIEPITDIVPEVEEQIDIVDEIEDSDTEQVSEENNIEEVEEAPVEVLPTKTVIEWNPSWEYADFSNIHSDSVTLYRAPGDNRKDVVIAVNAGHGTSGGGKDEVKTLSHPDGTPKVTGGTNAAGEVKSMAVSSGTTFLDGTSEASITLKLARTVKKQLLEDGYDVLMIRDSSDTQLDNIARTVFANNNADCHIALHYDYTETDKGLYYMYPVEIESYRAMEPVASHWQEHIDLGEALLIGMRNNHVKIKGKEDENGNVIEEHGSEGVDLTQISYSTIPSVDVEVGDKASDYSKKSLKKIAKGISEGLDNYNFNK